ncbi:MAG TPA: hypothetical protein VIJ87_17875, partial [Pyrinomonadaceae bacterium]
ERYRTICQLANHLKREVLGSVRVMVIRPSTGFTGEKGMEINNKFNTKFTFCALTSRCRPAPSL